MPQSISIAAFVLGGVLLLVAVIGGNFKIFGAEVSEKISSVPTRILAGLLGIVFVLAALAGSIDVASKDIAPKTDKPEALPPQTPSQPQVQTKPAKPPLTSRFGVAIVFDPPSNVREAPLPSSNVLCSVREKTTINILSVTGQWYSTDVCGKVGYIHQTQIRFSE